MGRLDQDVYLLGHPERTCPDPADMYNAMVANVNTMRRERTFINAS